MYYMPHYEYALEKHIRLTKQTNTPAKISFSCLMWWVHLSVWQYSTRCFVFFAWQRRVSHQRMRQNPCRWGECWGKWKSPFAGNFFIIFILNFCLYNLLQDATASKCWLLTLKRMYDTVFLWNVWRSVSRQRSWASMIDVQHFGVILDESCCSNKIYLSDYDQRYEGKSEGGQV